MDPECALQALLVALQERDVIAVEEIAQGLLRWLDQGGFPPKTIGQWKLGQEWHVRLTRQVCAMALDAAAEISTEATPPE